MQIFTPLVYLAVRMSSITGHSGSGSWSAKEKFNAFMHGLSSNYPDAERYKKLGTRAKDSKGQDATYYKVATKADELEKYLYSD